MITFSHGDNSFYLGPSAVMLGLHFTGDTKKDGNEEEMNTKVLNVDGVIHALLQTPAKELRQDLNVVEGECS